MGTENAIVVEDLRKTYGATKAVDGVSFAVAQGEVFGMLGPNGAGKSTTIEIVEGLRTADAGSVTVLGLRAAARGAGHQDAHRHPAPDHLALPAPDRHRDARPLPHLLSRTARRCPPTT